MLSSAPPSPSAAFHPHSRPYHASSRRTSGSSCAQSPRFQVSSAPSRRLDQQRPSSAQSPVPAFARSPQIRRREYADASTQYTPPGYPPTYRPPEQEQQTITTTTEPDPLPEPSNSIAHIQRGETSATPVTTEPPEPNLRTDPQPVVPAQSVQPTRRASRDIEADAQRAQQRVRQSEASPASPEQSSPAKRPRSLNQNVKVMPFNYETCDVKDLGVLISDMLMELVRLNDEMPLRDGQLTRFHSRYCSYIYHVSVDTNQTTSERRLPSPSRTTCSALLCMRHFPHLFSYPWYFTSTSFARCILPSPLVA